MRSYKKIRTLSTLDEVMVALYTNKSIYFSPGGKAMPTKFFLCWAWMSSEKFIKHIEAGNFVEIIPWREISIRRIKSALIKADINFINRQKP
jgi:hypothetical protein